jgi:hypothetical protein
MLHDPHKIPEPVLVVSGLTYLYPCYLALSKHRMYDAGTYLFLTFTTVGFHSTRHETLFMLDCVAIINFLARSYHVCRQRSLTVQAVFFLSVFYSFTSYFAGLHYTAMSFHPDWNTQMFFHALMHLSTSYSASLIMDF